MMNKEVTKMKKLEKGFTLIELMIVVAIIAILAAVAAPKFADQIKKAKDAKAIAVLGAVRSASNIYYADNDGAWASDLGTLYDEVDGGSQQVFTADPATASTGALKVGSNTNGLSSTTVAITLVGTGSTATFGSITYSEGNLYLGDADATDTKGNLWVEY